MVQSCLCWLKDDLPTNRFWCQNLWRRWVPKPGEMRSFWCEHCLSRERNGTCLCSLFSISQELLSKSIKLFHYVITFTLYPFWMVTENKREKVFFFGSPKVAQMLLNADCCLVSAHLIAINWESHRSREIFAFRRISPPHNFVLVNNLWFAHCMPRRRVLHYWAAATPVCVGCPFSKESKVKGQDKQQQQQVILIAIITFVKLTPDEVNGLFDYKESLLQPSADASAAQNASNVIINKIPSGYPKMANCSEHWVSCEWQQSYIVSL